MTYEASFLHSNVNGASSPVEALLKDGGVTGKAAGEIAIGNSFDNKVQLVFSREGKPGIDKVLPSCLVLVLKQEEG